LLIRHGAITETLNKAEAFVARATAALNIFKDSPIKSALLEAAIYSTSRANG
jgi:geranylgeranyl pyrophosphate synthase